MPIKISLVSTFPDFSLATDNRHVPVCNRSYFDFDYKQACQKNFRKWAYVERRKTEVKKKKITQDKLGLFY